MVGNDHRVEIKEQRNSEMGFLCFLGAGVNAGSNYDDLGACSCDTFKTS